MSSVGKDVEHLELSTFDDNIKLMKTTLKKKFRHLRNWNTHLSYVEDIAFLGLYPRELKVHV